MKFSSKLKKRLGIALIVIFLPIQFLFFVSLLYIVFTDDAAILETSMSFIFTMGIFLVPLFYGFRLWKEGTRKSSFPPDTVDAGILGTPSKVTIHTRIELSEYRRVILHTAYQTPLFVFIHFLAVTMLIYYVVIGVGDWFVIFLSIFVVYLPIGIFRSANSNYRAAKMLHEPVTYEFSLDKIAICGTTFNSTMEWRSLYKIKELKNWFLLYTNKQMAMLIPKRAFSTSEDMEVFRAMAYRAEHDEKGIAGLKGTF